MLEPRFPRVHSVADQRLGNTRDVAGQVFSHESVMDEKKFSSSPTVLELRFPRGDSVAEQRLMHEDDADEQGFRTSTMR